jgi:hypothetical protein
MTSMRVEDETRGQCSIFMVNYALQLNADPHSASRAFLKNTRLGICAESKITLAGTQSAFDSFSNAVE